MSQKFSVEWNYPVLLDNVARAKAKCESTGNDWGIKHWDTVLKQLLRRAEYQHYKVKQTV
jgi:hypothetical protein